MREEYTLLDRLEIAVCFALLSVFSIFAPNRVMQAIGLLAEKEGSP